MFADDSGRIPLAAAAELTNLGAFFGILIPKSEEKVGELPHLEIFRTCRDAARCVEKPDPVVQLRTRQLLTTMT